MVPTSTVSLKPLPTFILPPYSSQNSLRARTDTIPEIGRWGQPQFITSIAPIVRVSAVSDQIVIFMFGATSGQHLPFITAAKISLFERNNAELIMDILRSSALTGSIHTVSISSRFMEISQRWATILRDFYLEKMIDLGFNVPQFVYDDYPSTLDPNWQYFFEANPVDQSINRVELHIHERIPDAPLLYPNVQPGHSLALPVPGHNMEDVD